MSDYSRLFARIDELTARAERAEAAHRMCSVTEAKLLDRIKRAEAAIQRVRELATQWQHRSDFALFGDVLAAALDDPVEAAPEESKCPKARVEPGGCLTEWRFNGDGVWHHCEDVRRGPHRQHVCACGNTISSLIFDGSDAGLPADREERTNG